jgi:hypothetical protein
MTVKELLSDPNNWCKNYFAVDKDGKGVSPENSNAVKFCLRGAIQHCYPDDEEKQKLVAEKLRTALRTLTMPDAVTAKMNRLVGCDILSHAHLACFNDTCEDHKYIAELVNKVDV